MGARRRCRLLRHRRLGARDRGDRRRRAGAPPRDAVRSAAISAPPGLAAGLHAAAAAAERGIPLLAALERWAAASDLDGAELVVTALTVTAGAGGDPARSLAAVSDTLRDRRSLRREVRALSSQARASAAVIAVAPLGFAVLASGADGETARFLLSTPLGLACVGVGGLLDLAGWWWMDHITRSVA
jgi:tight adherence protein B